MFRTTRQTSAESAWIDLLNSPDTHIHINFENCPPRFVAFSDWDTGVQKLDEHLIYFVAEGACIGLLNQKRVMLLPGTLMAVAPGTVFRFYQSRSTPTSLIFRLRLKIESRRQRRQIPWTYRALPNAWHLLETVKKLIQSGSHPTRFQSQKLRNLASLFFLDVMETQPRRCRQKVTLSDAQKNAVDHHIATHLSQRLQISDLAKLLNLSHDYFSRIFRNTYGKSPRVWLLKQRLLYASILLKESTSTITQIASKLGYPDIYLFSRQFHALFGISPQKWRQSQ